MRSATFSQYLESYGIKSKKQEPIRFLRWLGGINCQSLGGKFVIPRWNCQLPCEFFFKIENARC